MIKNLLIGIVIALFGGNRYEGTYADAFGSQIELRQNGTFKYSWHFDLAGSWTTGKWTMKNDTLRLHIVPVYDTLAKYNPDKTFAKDTLVLSADEIANRCTEQAHVMTLLSSGGQNRQLPDTIFYLKRDRLIVIKDGRLQTKKVKGFSTNKKYKPWYVKQ